MTVCKEAFSSSSSLPQESNRVKLLWVLWMSSWWLPMSSSVLCLRSCLHSRATLWIKTNMKRHPSSIPQLMTLTMTSLGHFLKRNLASVWDCYWHMWQYFIVRRNVYSWQSCSNGDFSFCSGTVTPTEKMGYNQPHVRKEGPYHILVLLQLRQRKNLSECLSG